MAKPKQRVSNPEVDNPAAVSWDGGILIMAPMETSRRLVRDVQRPPVQKRQGAGDGGVVLFSVQGGGRGADRVVEETS